MAEGSRLTPLTAPPPGTRCLVDVDALDLMPTGEVLRRAADLLTVVGLHPHHVGLWPGYRDGERYPYGSPVNVWGAISVVRGAVDPAAADELLADDSTDEYVIAAFGIPSREDVLHLMWLAGQHATRIERWWATRAMASLLRRAAAVADHG